MICVSVSLCAYVIKPNGRTIVEAAGFHYIYTYKHTIYSIDIELSVLSVCPVGVCYQSVIELQGCYHSVIELLLLHAWVLSLSHRTLFVACLGARLMGIELLMFDLGLCHLSWHACTYHVVFVLIFKLRPLGNWVMRVGFKRSKRGNNRLCNTTPRRMPQNGRRCQQWSCPNIPQPFSYCCCCCI